jgi:uncharacterized protein (TIGR03083 family)
VDDRAQTAYDALHASYERMSSLTQGLDADDLRTQSYASEWTVAQVLSHLGSQSEIFHQFLAAGIAGKPIPGTEIFPPVWDRWNALTPEQQAAEGLVAARRILDSVAELPPDRADELRMDLFGRTVDLEGFLQMRLSEYALHTWDVDVALDPDAVIPADAVVLLVDRLPAVVKRSGRPASDRGAAPVAVRVRTTEPSRDWLLSVDDAATLTPWTDASMAQGVVELPAEAFVRLVYGRMDEAHTPATVTADRDLLDALRAAFPGI